MDLRRSSFYQGLRIGVHIPVKQPADGHGLDTHTYNTLRCGLRCLTSMLHQQ